MADNITLPATGTGTATPVVATDDIAGLHYQRIKLIHGVDGTNAGDVATTNPLPVAPYTAVIRVQTDVTRPADTAVYAAGDAISDSTATPTTGGFTFTSAARKSGGSGIIIAATFSSANDPATRLSGELFIFDQAVTAVNDNAAFAVSDAEIKTLAGVVPFSLFDAGNNGFCAVNNIAIPFVCVGSANLRFLLRARNAYTPASGEVITCTIYVQPGD